jgi:hypothetical protein
MIGLFSLTDEELPRLGTIGGRQAHRAEKAAAFWLYFEPIAL